jgi:hypothetical protein
MSAAMDIPELIERLQTAHGKVWEIHPNWQDPQKFHEARSELTAFLKSLITELQTGIRTAVGEATPARRRRDASTAAPAPTPVSELPAPAVTVSANEAERAPESAPAALVNEAELPPESTPTALARKLERPELCHEPTAAADSSESCCESVSPALGVDLCSLQSAITTAATALTGFVAEVGELGQALRVATADVKVGLTARSAPPAVTQPAPAQPPVPTAPPIDTSPEALYCRSDLQTPDGMAMCASLWAANVPRADIARAFGYGDHTGASCVAVAIAQFLQSHCAPAETVTLSGESGRELAKRVLARLGFRPGLGLPAAPIASATSTPAVTLPVSAAKRSNGNGHADDAAIASVERSAVPQPLAARVLPALPPLPPGQHSRTELRTDAARVHAAELWLQGYTQQAIGEHFSYETSGPPQVSLALTAFMAEYGCPEAFDYSVQGRKACLRDALQTFHAPPRSTPSSSGEHQCC